MDEPAAKRTLPINQLINAFRRCLVSILPFMDEVNVEWRDDKSYDDWDRIARNLFRSMVSTPIEFTFQEGQSLGLPDYRLAGYDATRHSLLYDENIGLEFYFSSLMQQEEPFDLACFVSIGPDWQTVTKPLNSCAFAVLLRDRRTSAGIAVTRIANIE